MKILYIGDIMGRAGVRAVDAVLPVLRKEHAIDLVVAQAENVTYAKGMSIADMQVLRSLGVDFFTGGNHTVDLEELYPELEDGDSPVIGPANMPSCPGKGWKYAKSTNGPVLVISLLGSIVGKNAHMLLDNPLKTIDTILEQNKDVERVATIVNFHGDFSSEKIVIGYYLDGRVTGVIGDHWHVPTADAMVLLKGTAHITDVGMCGVLHSSLGVKTDVIINRWRDGKTNRNELEMTGPLQLNAVLIESDDSTGLATSITQIQKTIDQ